MAIPFVETLERRQLFAGVTLITHGRDGHLWGFVDTAAAAITTRLGGAAQAPEYILTLTPDAGDGHLVPSIAHVDGTGTPQTSSSGEIIIKLDWTSVDANTDYQLSYVGSVVADFFMNTPVDGVRLAELPFHGISISRGTGLIDEIASSLGQKGVWVDQETYCDPNPVGVMGDAPPTIYDNVEFVDNYWRWDGNPNNFSTNGHFVDGAYNLNVQWLDSHFNGWALAHLVPAGYYVGTIDLNTTNGGEGPIYSDWYGNTPDKPARNQTGFLYSRIIGGDRPLSGVWSASGGTGARTAAGQSGLQWANISDVSVTEGSAIAGGQIIHASFIQQDRDSNSTVTFFIDHDQNPYDGSFVATAGTANFSPSGSSATNGIIALSTNGAGAGSYYICAKIEDQDGHTRYAYSKQFAIAAASVQADNAYVDPNGILYIFGTSGNDVIKISQSPSVPNSLKVILNDRSMLFSTDQVNKVFAYGGDGNDYISLNQRYGVVAFNVRFRGNSGMDTLIGGYGNDTLIGDEGNDRLYGGPGRDHLYGGDGTDRLYGGTGRDWFIGYKTKELMDRERLDILEI